MTFLCDPPALDRVLGLVGGAQSLGAQPCDEYFIVAFVGGDRAVEPGMLSVDTVDNHATDPRPPAAIPWGSTNFLRLRVGRYRVLYEINDRLVRIDVIHLGRSS